MYTAIDNTITIEAPDGCFDRDKVGGVLSARINPATEEVIWRWTHLPNGDSHVSGYTIIQKGEL